MIVRKSLTNDRAKIIDQIVEFVSGRKIETALDSGCGFCAIPLFLQNRGDIKGPITGIDILDDMIFSAKELTKKCNGNANILFEVAGDPDFSECHKDQFDLVTCLDGIIDLDFVEPTLAQIATVCKPGGLVIFTHPINGNGNDYYIDHLYEYGDFRYLRGYETDEIRYTYALEKVR